MRIVAYSLISLTLIAPTTIFAANILPPGTIQQLDPGRTGEELTPQEELPSLLDPDLLLLPPVQQFEFPDGQQGSIILGGITLTGNKVFSSKHLEQCYSDYVGQNISIADVQKIARCITVLYRNAGYILTQVVIPPQKVDASGIVELKVVEGYIENFSVEGEVRPATKKLLLAYAQHIASQKPLKLEVLERYALLANDIPGSKIKAVIRPSETPGAADLIFVAQQQLNNWYVGANSFNSELLGREQMVAGVNANAYLSGSQTGVRGVMSFYVNRMKYFAFLHKQQLNSNGLGFDANISNTTTNPSFESLDLVALQTPGQAFILNANTTYPIIRSRMHNLIIGAGFKYLNSHTSYYGMRLFDDATRTIDVKAAYNFFTFDGSINAIEIGLYQGLNILNAHASPPTIPGGKTNFSKITASANRYQRSPSQNFFILLWVKGQYAFTQLLSSEKFGFGGAPFGYGYDPSVITGDQGYALKIEPQYNYHLKRDVVPQIQFFGFFDTASIWNINDAVQPGHQSATSMGAGLRTIAYKRLSIELIVAQPFETFATNNYSNNTRFLFNLNYSGGTIFG